MRKIIVPTDFSMTAWNALVLCVRMFKYEICEIYILHCISTNNSGKQNSSEEHLLKNALKKVSEQIQKINKISANPRHHFLNRIGYGGLVDEINDLCDREDIDIVVMGTMGRSSYQKKALGSNTLAVIKFIKSPVLCVPTDYNFENLENILFPTNYLIPYQNRELKLVEELARRFVSKVHFLYASKFPPEHMRQKENEQFLAEFFKNNIAEFVFRNSAPLRVVIENFLEEIKADLLVMVNSEHTYFSHLLTSASIDNFTLTGKIPILVLQNLNRE